MCGRYTLKSRADLVAGNQVSPVLVELKKQFPKKKDRLFNWPIDIFVRWRQNSLYFVLVLKTPHGRPPTFESKIARMTPTSSGKFELAFPMRRGWNTFLKQASLEKCLKELREGIFF